LGQLIDHADIHRGGQAGLIFYRSKVLLDRALLRHDGGESAFDTRPQRRVDLVVAGRFKLLQLADQVGLPTLQFSELRGQ